MGCSAARCKQAKSCFAGTGTYLNLDQRRCLGRTLLWVRTFLFLCATTVHDKQRHYHPFLRRHHIIVLAKDD
jgi:hypothetical protein